MAAGDGTDGLSLDQLSALHELLHDAERERAYLEEDKAPISENMLLDDICPSEKVQTAVDKRLKVGNF